MKVLIDKYGSMVEAEVLFVVNNNEKNNTSILGVFSTPEIAYKAIEEQKNIIRKNNVKVPSMSVKCVVLDGSGYEGFRTFPGDVHNTTKESLGENPNIRRSLERVVRHNFIDVEVENASVMQDMYY